MYACHWKLMRVVDGAGIAKTSCDMPYQKSSLTCTTAIFPLVGEQYTAVRRKLKVRAGTWETTTSSAFRSTSAVAIEEAVTAQKRPAGQAKAFAGTRGQRENILS